MPPPPLLRESLLGLAGLALGALTALVELAYLLCAAALLLPVAVWPRARTPVLARLGRGARALAAWELRRVVRFHNGAGSTSGELARTWAYLACRVPVGLAAGTILLLLVYGVATVVLMLGAWFKGGSILNSNPDAGRVSTGTILTMSLPGLVLLYLALQGLYTLSTVERALVTRFLGPSPAELRQRIEDLSTSRAGIVAAVDEERRRIERALHDGVQQRLVALGLLLGRARRGTDPARANLLLAQAHEESQDILTDLREVAWRIYPTALDNLGLRDAIARAVDHTPLPADLDLTLHPDDRPPPEVETAAYFIISEALTNTTKHANATHLSIQVTQTPTALALRITDNGKGGATPTGTGLSGLHRRVAAMDGTFHLTSPPGHGTTITAHLPYP